MVFHPLCIVRGRLTVRVYAICENALPFGYTNVGDGGTVLVVAGVTVVMVVLLVMVVVVAGSWPLFGEAAVLGYWMVLQKARKHSAPSTQQTLDPV